MFGSIVNTNTVYLSQQMIEMGIDVMYHMTVGDNPLRLKEMIRHAYADCDLIITTGGLGPTQDDLTKEMIAEAFDEKIVTFPDQREILENHFKKYNRPMTDNNLKQANFPESATIFPNANGTAPGFAWKRTEAHRIHARTAQRNADVPTAGEAFLGKNSATAKLVYKTLRVFELGESMLETRLLDLINGQTDPRWPPMPDHESTLRIASKRKTWAEAEAAVGNAAAGPRKDRPVYYSEDDEDPLDIVIRHLLRKASVCPSPNPAQAVPSPKRSRHPRRIGHIRPGIVTHNRAKIQSWASSLRPWKPMAQSATRQPGRWPKASTRQAGAIFTCRSRIAGPGGRQPENRWIDYTGQVLRRTAQFPVSAVKLRTGCTSEATR